ncbi:MAG: hypothetical protein ACYTHJ_03210 [Planctomycetota bacterium]|jgi:hypothetical protein
MSRHYEQLTVSQRTGAYFKWLTIVGVASFVMGLIFAPQRAWSSFLLVNVGLLGMGLGAALFIACNNVCGAHWAVALRRVPEAMCGILPWAAVGILISLLAGTSLYPWISDHPHGMKGIILDHTFVVVRAIVFLGLWLWLIRAMVARSRLQDQTGSADLSASAKKLSAIFLVVFGLTFWMAVFDWVMSLEPEWYSTMYGVYHFSGLFLGALAAMTLLAIWLHHLGPLRDVLTTEHLHDLGKLLFGFSTFWMYIWFSEYMLIWYANFPEETGHFIRRQTAAWGPLFVTNMFVTWLIPFFVLLPKSVKRSPRALVKVSCLILVGRWLDLYLLIYPATVGFESVTFGIWELGMAIGAPGCFMLIFVSRFRSAAPFPVADPMLEASLHHHQ